MPPPRKRQRKSPEFTQSSAADSLQVDEKQDNVTSPDHPTTSSGKQDARTLFIRSLPPTTTTENLTALFSATRPIKHATAVLDPTTQQCKGYGFVTFADVEDAAAARDEFHGHLLKGELGDDPDEVLGRVEDDAAQEKGIETKKRRRRLRVEFAQVRNRGEGKDPGDKIEREKGKKLERDLQKGSKVIVRNLPWSVKSGDQLGRHFQNFGGLKAAVVPKKRGGLLQGFGFVTFKGHKAAEKAVKEGSGLEIDGRKVAVDWAVQRDVYKDLQGNDAEANAEGEEDLDVKTEDEDELIMNGDDENNDSLDDEVDSHADGSSQDDDGENNSTDPDGDGEDDEDAEEEDRSGTLFIRNLPFTCTDEDLEEVFRTFGSVRYARVVLDPSTSRPKGTGFVCFYNPDEANECLRKAPRHVAPKQDDKSKAATMSVLQDESLDPTGRYTLDGRVLQVTRAVARTEANRLAAHGATQRFNRDKDRRRLYLLSEGTINSKSPLYARLSPTERQLRESSAKQRKQIIESNPSLHLSLTRLSIRNIPRSVTSKDLKQLAREAIVGFAADVKEGKRQKLSKEELNRGGEEMKNIERERREQKKGVVKQAKIVFEGKEGGKVDEKTGAGRSRGYGFIEYYTHRNALMGLRWLNGHMVDYKALNKVKERGKAEKDVVEDRKKRLIVEFAIENAQVVQRRKEKEVKARERSKAGNPEGQDADESTKANVKSGKKNGKRKRPSVAEGRTEDAGPEDEKLAKRQRIIQKKRMMRRAKKQGRVFKA